MSPGIAAVVWALAAVTVSQPRPSGPARLGVTRAPGAETCADAGALASMVADRLDRRALDPEALASSESFDVEFSRAGGRFRAVIRASGQARGARVIEDASDRCEPLVEAVALSLSLAIRAASSPGAPPPAPPSPPPSAPPALPGPLPARSEARAGPRLTLGAGGGLAMGVVRTGAPLLVAGAMIRVASVRAGIEALFIPTQQLPLREGSVEVGLIGGSALACLDLARAAVDLSVCASASAGALRAEGRDFTTNRAATRPWGAAGAHLELSTLAAGPLGLFARAGMVVPVSGESFSVDGVGTAYTPPRVSLLMAAGATVSIE